MFKRNISFSVYGQCGWLTFECWYCAVSNHTVISFPMEIQLNIFGKIKANHYFDSRTQTLNYFFKYSHFPTEFSPSNFDLL